MKDLNEYTQQELLDMPYKQPDGPFNGVIIVPTGLVHDSGYMRMNFVLCLNDDIVGVIRSYSDVIYPNGPFCNASMRIDCLANSSCIRLNMNSLCTLDDHVDEDFIFYQQ